MLLILRSFLVVQLLSCAWLFGTPWTATGQASNCSSLSPGACSNSCPLSWWCHPTISSFVIPFFSCFQSYPASGSFPVSQFFTSGGQSIGASASASVPPMNIHNWFPSGLFGLIFSNSSYSQESSPIPQFKSFNSLILSLLCLCICLYCFSPDQSKISCFFSYLGRHF